MASTPPWALADPCAAIEHEQCYGEISRVGLSRVLSLLNELPECSVGEGDELLDVGSGFGRAATFMRRSVEVRVTGIEINRCRASAAMKRAKRTHGLNLILGDVRRLGFGNASHVYLTSQCFGHDLLRELFGRLANRAPRLRCVVDVGSLDALSAQSFPLMASLWGRVAAIGREVRTSWDSHAAALFVTRGTCNASCVRRAERRLAQAAEETEAHDLPGPQSPWQRPAAVERMWELWT